MKKAAYGLLAAFLAQGVYGAIPKTAEGWYTPSEWRTVELDASYERNGVTYGCAINADGEILWGDGKINDPLVRNALETAVEAWWNTYRNNQKFEKLGQELHDLTSKTGIKITNPETGRSYTIKFDSGTIAEAVGSASGDIPATTDMDDPADLKSLNWTDSSASSKIQLYGWATQAASGNLWGTYSTPVAIPVRTAAGATMAYHSWYGVDRLSLVPNPDTHKLELSGWRSEGSGIMTPLAEAITKAEADKGAFDEYELVVRNSSKGLNYVALGTLNLGGVAVDGATITTNTAEGAATQGALSLYGWSTANGDASGTAPVLPYADGGGNLAWRGVLDFFNTGLFDLTSDGKVNLKGVSAGEDDLRVMTVSAGDSGAAITSSSISSMLDAPLDMEDQKITVSGWKNATPSAGDTLAQRLTGGAGQVNNPAQSPSLLTRTASGGVAYMAIGTLGGGISVDGESIRTNAQNVASLAGYESADADMVPFKGADGLEWRELADGVPADGKSITTNTTDGAITSGEASLRGYATASDWAIPYKHGEGSGGTLDWKTPDEWCGVSLAWGDDGSGNKKLDVVGANDYAGKHSKHYFGTSNDKTATLGWHELPNVTTNRVEGDEATIASTVDEQDPGLKRLGLRGWNYQYGGDPLFVVNAGGSIGYIPLPALTNLAACACTQKWENAVAWIGGDAALDEDGGLTLPDDSLDEYLYNTLGYIYSTTPGNLHFDNDGEQIQASFTAPENWADGDSVELTDEGAYQVAGWAGASACAASMSAMLSQPTGSDATTHLLLAKKTDTGELHYVSIGDGIQSGAAVDDTTITTNTAHGATTQGEASIYGWANAANDTYLSKNAGGNLEWRAVPGGTPDEASITTNATAGAVTGGAMSILGFASAQDGTTPVKQNNSIVWSKAESAIEAGSGISITSNNNAQVVSHNLVAGAGISITPASSGTAVTIASATPTSGTVVDPHAQELTFITELYYDSSSHQIKAKRITAKVMFVGTVPTAEEFTVVQCTPHSAEHVSDE